MKIVNRDTFLALPPGTLYHEYEPQAFGPMEVFEGMIECNTFAQDYVSEFVGDPTMLIAGSSNDTSDLLHSAEQTGASFELTYGESATRDGCFERSQMYAVYERQDVERLITYLQQQLERLP